MLSIYYRLLTISIHLLSLSLNFFSFSLYICLPYNMLYILLWLLYILKIILIPYTWQNTSTLYHPFFIRDSLIFNICVTKVP